MPEQVDDFYTLLKTFFPTVYDIKFLIKDLKNLKDAGLSKLAAELRVI
jgi:CCR4-NOT transcription complex subunit 7/8